MKAYLSYFLLFYLFFGCICPVHAQPDLSKFEIGLNGGAYIYQGDLPPAASGSWRTAGLGLSIWGSKLLNNALSVRLQLARGKLKGDDAKYNHPAWRQQRNFNFQSPVTELSALLVWDVFGNDFRNNTIKLTPYLFAGAGAAFLHIRRDWSNLNQAYFSETDNAVAGIGTDAAHRLPTITPVVPVGIGIRYPVAPRLSINAEGAYRFMFTDYLDGFSRAANPALNDHYYTASVGLSYSMGKRLVKNKKNIDCPVVRE
ncbi:MAG: hypothetical protein ICV53_02705 [Flavisolibacter sp.]|nr:hypothetical protein [Flavisolibacter sp.]